MGEWISVKKRTPAAHTYWLVCRSGGNVQRGYWTGDEWEGDNFEDESDGRFPVYKDVTHYTHIPAPPTEQGA